MIISIALAIFILFLQPNKCVETFSVNSNVVDYAIAIHYGATQPDQDVPVGHLVFIIDYLADNLNISADKTRLAIIEFGDKEKILLKIEDGADKLKIRDAIDQIGKGSFVGRSSFAFKDIAKPTQEMLARSERLDVPKLALYITVEEAHRFDGTNNNQYLTGIVKTIPLAYLGDALFMSTYDETNQLFHHYEYGYMFLWKNPRPTPYVSYTKNNNPETQDFIARKVRFGTTQSLSLCPFFKYAGNECRNNDQNECVTDVLYDLAYDNDLNPATPLILDQTWRVVHYCFKNATATQKCDDVKKCPPITTRSTSPTTDRPTTNANESIDGEDDDDVMYEDDPYYIMLKNTLYGLAIVAVVFLVIDIFAGFWAWKLWRQNRLAENANKSQIDGGKSVFNPSAFSISVPPEMTITPTDELVKNYATAGVKAQKSTDASKSIKAKQSIIPKETKKAAQTVIAKKSILKK